MNNNLPSFLLTNEIRTKKFSGNKHSLPFIDRTLTNIAQFVKTGYIHNDIASKIGWMQNLSTWVKTIFLLGFIILISINKSILSQIPVFLFLILLYALSRINLIDVYKRILTLSLFFGFLFIAPAALNIITDGTVIFPIIRFKAETTFWVYRIPATIGITREGCLLVIRFCLKVTNSIALTFLIMHTTTFTEIIKSLKMLRVPDLLLLVITLTYKYLFILSQTTEETYLALKSRWWQKSRTADSSKIIAGRISYLFRKSWVKYEEIYLAMVARGYTGKVTVVYSQKIYWHDMVFLLCSIAVGSLCFII